MGVTVGLRLTWMMGKSSTLRTEGLAGGDVEAWQVARVVIKANNGGERESNCIWMAPCKETILEGD